MSGGTAAYAFLSGTMLKRRDASCCYAILLAQSTHGMERGRAAMVATDEELFAVLEDRRQGWDDYDGDDADAVDAMLKMSPAATDNELAQRYTDYSAECYAILREPTVWSAIERVAAKLMERGKLSTAEALEAIGGDAAKLHP
jgi:hypothetical protein